MYDWQWMTIMWRVWIIWTTVISDYVVFYMNESNDWTWMWLLEYKMNMWMAMKRESAMIMWMIMVYQYDSVYMLDRPIW